MVKKTTTQTADAKAEAAPSATTYESLLNSKTKFDRATSRLQIASNMVLQAQSNRLAADRLRHPELNMMLPAIFAMPASPGPYVPPPYAGVQAGGYNQEQVLARAISDEELDLIEAKSMVLLQEIETILAKYLV